MEPSGLTDCFKLRYPESPEHVSVRAHGVFALDRFNCQNQTVIKFWHSETVCVIHVRSPSHFSEQLNWNFWDINWTLGASQRSNGSVCAPRWCVKLLKLSSHHLCQRKKKKKSSRTAEPPQISMMMPVSEHVPIAAKVESSATFPSACANKPAAAPRWPLASARVNV